MKLDEVRNQINQKIKIKKIKRVKELYILSDIQEIFIRFINGPIIFNILLIIYKRYLYLINVVQSK
jgi:hypothetical protein